MSKEMLFLCDVFDKWLDENDIELLHTLKDKIYTIKEKQYETV